MENYLEGILVGNSRGFGFVKVEGCDDEFFIPPDKMFGAMDGDKVVIQPMKTTEKGPTAEIKKILEYANQTVVGNLKFGMSGNYVVADNPRFHKTVLIAPKDLNCATIDDKVVVKVTAQPGGSEDLRGVIQVVLGNSKKRSVLEKAIICEKNIPDEFTEEVLTAADNIPQEISDADRDGRTDLRDEIIFTIDGDDTRDIDDAISVEKLDNGHYKLGVHIADVGNYVKRGSVIDKSAFERGTSCYFPGYVIPMLPTSLSNGICSLNEGVDRLALSCVMEIDENGEIVDHQIFESVINSNARLTYNKVFATLNGEATEEKYQKLKEKFFMMKDLCEILYKRRTQDGYLELDLPETYFELNEKGEIIDIKNYDRNITHEMIEQFMICANITVAKHFKELKLPFVYRVHETPTPEKSTMLFDFMEAIGVNTANLSREVTPKNYQKILKSVDGEPFEQVLNKVLLRSLQKAKYLEKPLGHFGLALKDYCHFTSPIRRYPDLTIHRIIKDSLHGKIDKIEQKDLRVFVEDASEQSSVTEKRAEMAERQVEALKMAEYMKKHIGEEFEGTVSEVTSFGVFVTLNNTIEGLIRLENLPETYEYFEKQMMLKNPHNKICIGDPIKVRVCAVDLPKRQIEFCDLNAEYKPRKEREELKPYNKDFKKFSDRKYNNKKHNDKYGDKKKRYSQKKEIKMIKTSEKALD